MDLSPGSVRADLEASLRRLHTDRVDLLQIHDVDPSTPIEETWGELQRLVEEGKVRHCGISNHPVDLIERALDVGPVGALQYSTASCIVSTNGTLFRSRASEGSAC
jgi:aryl-alcohol dehydrogenase-like predicted oxidoreductase